MENPVDVIFIATAFLALLIMFSFYALNKKISKLSQIPVQPLRRPLNPDADKQLTPMKLQAYERMILYVERIGLEGLVMRVFLPEMTAQQLQIALNRTIREEFEHNLTQQLYVSEAAWAEVKAAREYISSIIGQAYSNVSPSDNGMELAKLLFAIVQNPELYSFDTYPVAIKREMDREIR